MLIVVPLLGAQSPFLAPESATAFVHEAAVAAAASPSGNATASLARATNALRATFAASKPIARLAVDGNVSFEDSTVLGTLRATEVVTVRLESALSGRTSPLVTLVTFNDRLGVRQDAELSIGLTFFVTAVLALGALLLSHDTTELVVQPMEQMIGVAKDLSERPLATNRDWGKASGSGGFETSRLVKVLSNVPRLMRLSFGEAGASILASSLTQKGEVDLSASARLCDAVLLHVRIPSVSSFAPALRGTAGPFLRRIWTQVHSDATGHGGAVLESAADSCLIVWELVESDVSDDEARSSLMHFASSSGRETPDQLAAGKRKILRQRAAQLALSCASVIQMRQHAVSPWRSGDGPHTGAGAHGKTRTADSLAWQAASSVSLSPSNPEVFCAIHAGRVCIGPMGSVHQLEVPCCGPASDCARVASAAAARFGQRVLVTAEAADALGPKLRCELRHIGRFVPRRWGVRSAYETGDMAAASGRGPRRTGSASLSSRSADGRRPSLQHALQPKASFRKLAGESAATAGFGGDDDESERAALAFLAPKPFGMPRDRADAPAASTPSRALAGGRVLCVLGLDADWAAGADAAGVQITGPGSGEPAFASTDATPVDWSRGAAVREALLRGEWRNELRLAAEDACTALLGWPGSQETAHVTSDVSAVLRACASAGGDRALGVLAAVASGMSEAELSQARSAGFVWLDIDA